MTDTAKASSPIDDLSDRVGEFIQYWGFKKIHGRIWAHLYLSSSPLDAGALIERLGVSKALVSMSLSDLSQFNVIQEKGKSSRGTLLYVANPEVIAVILNVLKMREKKMLDQIAQAHQNAQSMQDQKPHRGIDPQRLKGLGEMITGANEALESFLSLYPVDFSQWQGFDEKAKLSQCPEAQSDPQ